MAIEEVIDVGVTGIGEIEDLAGASDKAAESIGKLKSELVSLGGSLGAVTGAGKFAAAWDDAGARVSGVFDKVRADVAGFGDASASAAMAGAGRFSAAWTSAAADVSASMDKVAAGVGKLDDLGAGAAGAAGEVKGLADAGDTAAAGLGRAAGAGKGLTDSLGGLPALGDGLKGVGTEADAMAAEIAAASAEMDKLIAKGDALSLRAGVSSASGAALNAKLDSSGYLATDSIEQDVMAARSAAARSATGGSAGGWLKLARDVAAGGAVAGAVGIDKSMKYQSEMLPLSTQAGMSMPDESKMSQGILEVSAQTGQSLSALAASAYHVTSNMESMGASVPKQLQAVRVAAEGATVGHADLVGTTNALTAEIASGIAGKRTSYSQAMGMLNATVGSGDMSMQDLSDAYGTGMLATVKGFGVTLPDVGAALATLGDNNIRGAKAGTEVRMGVQALGREPVSTTAQGAFKELKLRYDELSQDMQKGGLKLAVQDLDSHMKAAGLTGSKTGEILTDAFGMKAGSALNILTEQQDRFLSKYPQMVKGANDFSTEWAKTQQSPAQKWKELESGGMAAVTGFGTALLPEFSAAAGFADKILADINKSGSGAKGIAVAFGGAAALFTGKKLVDSVEGAFRTGETALHGLGKIGETLKIPGLDKLAGIGKGSAAGGMQAAADTNVEAAGRMQLAADTFAESATRMTTADVMTAGGGGLGTGGVARVAEGDGEQAGIEAAEAASVGMKDALTRTMGGLFAGAAVGSIAIPASMELDKYIQHKLGSTQGSGIAQVSSGAAAGAVTGAAAGSVIPGLGTAVGAIAGAIIGGVTTAVADHKAWNDMVQPPEKAHAAKYAYDGPTPKPGRDTMPTTRQQPNRWAEPQPRPTPAAPATWEWQFAHHGDQARHLYASHFSQARHGVSSAYDWMNDAVNEQAHTSANQFDDARHWTASVGHEIGSLFGWDAAPQKAAPYGGTPQPAQGHHSWDFGAQQVKPAKIAAPDLSALESAKGKVQSEIAGIDKIISSGGAAKIHAPDMSALGTAAGKLKAELGNMNRDIASASGKSAKIAAPDMSALDSAKTKAMSSGEGIQQAAAASLHKPAKAAAPDLSAYAAARGPATADGVAVSHGLANGITAGGPAAVAAAHSVAAQVEAAMNIHLQIQSPSKVTEKIGSYTSAGLAKGLDDGKSKVKASALTLSAATITSLTEGLQGGKDAVDAAMQAVTGKGSRPQDITTIISTVSTLKSDVAKALAAGQISKPEDSALTKMIAADNTKLQRLATQRTVLEQEITNSQQVAQSVISGSSITSAGQYTPALAAAGGPQAASQTITGMQGMASDDAAYAAQLKKLKNQGLNATSLSQLAQEGAQAGLPIAQGLAQGGKGAITQMNKLEQSIQSSAGKIGDIAGPAMYQAGQQAVAGIASGLKSGEGAIDAAIKDLASNMTAEFKKDLKIKSPSQVFHDLTMAIPQGAASGVDAGSHLAAAAVSRMGSRMTGAFHPLAYAGHGGGYGPSSGGTGGGGSRGGDTYHITVNVAGSVSSEQNLVNAVQRGLLKKGSQNWNTGIIRPGRGG